MPNQTCGNVNQNLRPVRTDRQDSIAIAKYGCEKWFSLKNFYPEKPVYSELKILGRQYANYMELHISALSHCRSNYVTIRVEKINLLILFKSTAIIAILPLFLKTNTTDSIPL